MPYQMKDGRWRAVKMIAGQRRTRLCQTKADAKKWEASQTEDDWKRQTVTLCLHEAATAYLDYSEARHHPTTYAAKRLALRRLFRYVRPNDGRKP